MAPGIRSPLHGFLAPALRWQRTVPLPRRGGKVAIMAQYSVEPRPTRSVVEFVRQLHGRSYTVILATTSTVPGDFAWPDDAPDVGILRKPNLGYDFGSWAVTLAECPRILEADRVLFVNDSLFGPFWSLDPIFDHFEASSADVWGLLRSGEIDWHLQSFFFGMRGEALRTPVLRRFWGDVSIERNHDDIVRRYEIGLSRILNQNLFSLEAMVHAPALGAGYGNATTKAWRQLLESGVPFVKRQLVNHRHTGIDADRIEQVLETEYGVALDDWRA